MTSNNPATRLLDGETAVVTGGSSGIGRSIALEFASHGADIVVADLRKQPRGDGPAIHEKIRQETDANAVFVECDVTMLADFETAMDAAEEFGGITVLVNNAGIIDGEGFLEVDEATYERVMAVNAKGVFFGAQAAGRRMVERGCGSIINISSTSGLEGSGSYPVYSASKGAVRLMTYAIAENLGPSGVRCNAIHPGPTETQMLLGDHGVGVSQEYVDALPLRRAARPEDIARVAVFLASDLSEYVTGISIPVDGGSVNSRGR